jgi:hypothetical protein
MYSRLLTQRRDSIQAVSDLVSDEGTTAKEPTPLKQQRGFFRSPQVPRRDVLTHARRGSNSLTESRT